MLKTHDGQEVPTPYMTVMDWGHDERDYAAGHPTRHHVCRTRNGRASWQRPRGMRARKQMGRSVRLSIRTRAATLNFPTRIAKVVRDIPYEVAGSVSGYRPSVLLAHGPGGVSQKYADKLDYVHFKGRKRNRLPSGCSASASASLTAAARARCVPSAQVRLTIRPSSRRSSDIGYSGYITIEQGRDPRNSDTSLRDVKASVDYLKSVGYEI